MLRGEHGPADTLSSDSGPPDEERINSRCWSPVCSTRHACPGILTQAPALPSLDSSPSCRFPRLQESSSPGTEGS